jgi:hypothetical protein
MHTQHVLAMPVGTVGLQDQSLHCTGPHIPVRLHTLLDTGCHLGLQQAASPHVNMLEACMCWSLLVLTLAIAAAAALNQRSSVAAAQSASQQHSSTHRSSTR